MADSDKNILIKPNIASTDSAPTIEFVGADSNVAGRTVTLNVISDNEGTLSFLNDSNNQIFSINNDEDGIIFSVNKFNDSSTPMIEVSADSGITGGLIKLAEFGGQVIIGGDSAQLGGSTPDSADFLVVHKNIRLLNSGQFIGSGAGLTGLQASEISGTLPALNASNLTNIPAGNLTGTLPAINGSNLTNISASSLSGYSWTQFLRSDTSDNFTSGTLEFNDNTMLAFGSSADTIIEHDTGYNPDVTRFYANSSIGGMLFQDGTTNIFDIAYTYANQAVFHNTTRFLDNIYFYFGTNADTWIRHNTSLSPQRTEFVASTSDGGMEFRDGTVKCFDVGVTNTSVTTFFETLRINDDAYLSIGSGNDTYIRHTTSGTDHTEVVANVGGILFKDNATSVFDIAHYNSNQATFHEEVLVRDDHYLMFGDANDTRIQHNTSNGSTDFQANTADGGMRFRDGGTTCFDVAETAADTTTFFQTVDVQGITKGTQTTNTNGTLDLSAGNLFKCTPSGGITLTLSNPSEGQAGVIMLDNSGGHTISAHASLAINADVLTALSTAGVYMLTYYCSAASGNDTILISATGALT